MTELPRFEPLRDSRPADQAWPPASWPIADAVVLRGLTVQLTKAALSDAAELLDALSDDRAWQHLPALATDVEQMQAQLQQRLSDASWHCWIIRLRSPVGDIPAGTVVGTTSFLDTVAGSARTEIGATQYSPDVWGTQVNPECKLLLLGYAFEVLGMGRVQLKTDVRNARSQQAIARLGAKYEGVLRRYQRRADGTVRDTVMFSITAEDWPDVRKRLQQRLGQSTD